APQPAPIGLFDPRFPCISERRQRGDSVARECGSKARARAVLGLAPALLCVLRMTLECGAALGAYLGLTGHDLSSQLWPKGDVVVHAAAGVGVSGRSRATAGGCAAGGWSAFLAALPAAA